MQAPGSQRALKCDVSCMHAARSLNNMDVISQDQVNLTGHAGQQGRALCILLDLISSSHNLRTSHCIRSRCQVFCVPDMEAAMHLP